MRWIFFSLIAANLAILGWWQTSKPQPLSIPHTYATPAGVGSIVLLSEAEKTTANTTNPADAANAPLAQGAEVLAPADTSTETSSPAGASEQAAVAPNADPAPVENHAQCVLVGPYDNNDLAQQALQKLQAKEINAHIYQMELAVTGGYQVYLDGFESRTQAKKRLDELQVSGIDSFIVPKGEYINTIALGSFDQEAAAKAQQEKFTAAGINAKVRESKRPLMELWVALPPEMGDTLPEPLRQTLGVGKGDKKKEERQILCSTIASSKNIL